MKERKEKIEKQIHDILSWRKRIKSQAILLIVWLFTLYQNLWFSLEDFILRLKQQYTIDNDLFLDLWIYLNFLTEEDLWSLEI